MNYLIVFIGGGGRAPLRHVPQLLGTRHLEYYLGLPILNPGGKVSRAEVAEYGSYRRVGYLSGDLPASHVEVRPDGHRQLHRHEKSLSRVS